jgi:hypothetical protein
LSLERCTGKVSSAALQGNAFRGSGNEVATQKSSRWRAMETNDVIIFISSIARPPGPNEH